MRLRFVGLLVIALVATFASPASAKPPPLGAYECEGFNGYGQLKIKPDKHYRFNGGGAVPNSRGEFRMTAPKKFKFTSGVFRDDPSTGNPTQAQDLYYKGKWGSGDGITEIYLTSNGWTGMQCFRA